MEIEITVILTGHNQDAGSDTDAIVLIDGEGEKEMVEILADVYDLGIPEGDTPWTWEWLEEKLGSYAWWRIEKRKITV